MSTTANRPIPRRDFVNPSPRRLLGRLSAVCAAGAAAVAVLPAAAAHASLLGLLNFNACNNSALSQPFTQWGDNASYELTPGGDFESSGWSLSHGASVVSGSEPYAVTGTLGSSSLSLPAGASAASPATCVDAAYPTVRFFVGGTGTVVVSVIYNGLTIPTGVAIAAGSWEPTLPMVTGSALWGLLGGGTAPVSVQFTALTGNPQVDDVFIDPYGGH
jgi:hypothetical protein